MYYPVYYICMVQPKDPPLSFRPGDERRERIEAWAAEHKVSRHLAILTLIDAGLRALTAPPPSPITERLNAAELASAKVAKPDDPAPKFKTRLKGEWKAP